jgi:hypothetical protein
MFWSEYSSVTDGGAVPHYDTHLSLEVFLVSGANSAILFGKVSHHLAEISLCLGHDYGAQLATSAWCLHILQVSFKQIRMAEHVHLNFTDSLNNGLDERAIGVVLGGLGEVRTVKFLIISVFAAMLWKCKRSIAVLSATRVKRDMLLWMCIH